ETRATVMRLYETYIAGDVDGAAEFLSDTVDWAILAPEYLFDFAGGGRGGGLNPLKEIWKPYEFIAYEPQLMMADGENACVYSHCSVRDRTTGREASFELCDVMRLKGGRIVWFREFVDSVKVAVTL